MKVIIVGGTGTIGKAAVKALSKNHDVIVAGRSHGDIQVDITDHQSIENMYNQVGNVDAVVSTVGKVIFDKFEAMSVDKYMTGLRDKLMGQVDLVLTGLPRMNDGGSFTLTTGILNHEPIVTGSSAAMVNGAVDSFVKAAAIEMPRGVRINSVSPTVITEAMDKYEKFFPGYKPVSAAEAALAYCKSVDGAHTGEVYKVGY